MQTIKATRNNKVLEAFYLVLQRESHVLMGEPELFWQQFYNRSQWKHMSLKPILALELKNRRLMDARPWIRIRTPFFESEAFIRMLKAHDSLITSCAFSPDGSKVISASWDKTLRIWDMKTGKEQLILRGHTGGIQDCAYSPDGSKIVSAGGTILFQKEKDPVFNYNRLGFTLDSDKTLKVWDAMTGKELLSLEGHTDSVTACAFNPDSSMIVSGSRDKTLKLWDVKTGKEILSFLGHNNDVLACAFSPDGNKIISGSADGTLRLWDVLTGKELEVFKGRQGSILDCAFSPNGEAVVSACKGKSLELWDIATGQKKLNLGYFEVENDAQWAGVPENYWKEEAKQLKSRNIKLKKLGQWGHTEDVNACAFSPDGSSVISASKDGTLKLWDINTGHVRKTFLGHKSKINDCAYSPDGSIFISSGSDGSICFWDAKINSTYTAPQGHTDRINDCAYSPDGSLLVTASHDKTLKLWNAETGQEQATLDNHTKEVLNCIFNPDGSTFVSSSYDGAIKLWDVKTGKELLSLKERSTKGIARAFSPDGSALLSASPDLTLTIWDIKKGRKLKTLKPYCEERLKGCAFSPDGSIIGYVSYDKALTSPHICILCDRVTGKKKVALIGHSHMITDCAFSPDGATVISASSDKTLRLWEAKTGHHLATLKCHPVPRHTFIHCAFSPDGSTVVSVTEDGILMLWDVVTRHKIAEFKTTAFHPNYSFTPDSSMIAMGSENKTLDLADITSGKKLATLPIPQGLGCIALHPYLPQGACGNYLGNLYFFEFEGIKYSPIVVTPMDFGSGTFIQCPACLQRHSFQQNWIGKEITCPEQDCRLHLHINPFVVKVLRIA